MLERSEQRFYSRLKDAFVGENIKGESGYVNLMKLRQKYFDKIEPHIRENVEKEVEDTAAREELYDKLYTFFDSYLNETGTVFFSDTQIHKNLYERVYSDREDVSLFWKTQDLYYVKSEAMYDDLETEIDGITFKFDASDMKHAKGNEKKQLEFHLAGIEDEVFTFKPRYVEQNTYDLFREYFEMDGSSAKIKNFIYENYPDLKHPQVKVITNELDHTVFTKTDFKQIISVYELNDAINTVVIEFSPSKPEHILKYFEEKNIDVNEDQLQKAFRIYKKQNEVDYFIHKDAKGFLSEQFDIYLYNYLFNDNKTEFTEERVQQIQAIKKIANQVIEYIARFEDELKAIWNKPKFVRNSNYVFTLDRISDNGELIEKIIEHPGFEDQIKEYEHLHEEWTDSEGNVTKKKRKEFELGAECQKEEILVNKDGQKQLNSKYQYLPIDTKHFDDLKWEVLDAFDHIEEKLDGYLIKSDNYQALNTLLPKFREEIDLIYIDPPFNTGDDFLYKDKFQDSTWLSLMYDRILLSYDLLNNQGNFYLHLDKNANFLGRMLCNNCFGEENFRSEIAYKRTQGHHIASGLDIITDNIFWYSKSEKFKYYQQYEKLSDEELDEKFPHVEKETGRRFS